MILDELLDDDEIWLVVLEVVVTCVVVVVCEVVLLVLETVVVVLLLPPASGAHVAPKAEAFLKVSAEDPLITSKVVALAEPICTVAL